MSNASYQSFIKSQTEQRYPPFSEQLSALETLFSDPSVPVSEIAKRAADPLVVAYNNAPNGSGPDVAKAARIMHSLNIAVRELTEYNDKLVQLVYEMHNIPGEEDAGIVFGYFNSEWTEFGSDFKYPRESDPARSAKLQEWINMNSFCAKLSLKGDSKVDRRWDSDWVFRCPLELTPWDDDNSDLLENKDLELEKSRAQYEYQLEERDIKSLNFWIPGAVAWIKINGQGIYDMTGNMSREYDWVKTTWKGPKGWSKERFGYWRERFAWVSTVETLDGRTKEDAREAANIMKNIEENAAKGS
ncbi:hypothetical protein P153DRAFT_351539 [Dothidotthia symphoricarpi CBS 119687]|uniref:Uncharacterized protein n=1 Tax=Dothidotthia symphoricarpi CBS 119687 TaxID=1392245 RepID=A0A6A5ZYH7_9PLEO|nr:uncharacterized protein P153DRAFT_351539 [Dothidotthia symphoricarpi CBS 119687]KAF2123954.1 hypothetical protein P153DRAFT_351539 [Dothidotthia symphoricarpi CBS 119687]